MANKPHVSQGVVSDVFMFSGLGCGVPELSLWLCLTFGFGWKLWMKKKAREGYCGRTLSCHVAQIQDLKVRVALSEETGVLS